jgi:hypothetical protein
MIACLLLENAVAGSSDSVRLVPIRFREGMDRAGPGKGVSRSSDGHSPLHRGKSLFRHVIHPLLKMTARWINFEFDC